MMRRIVHQDPVMRASVLMAAIAQGLSAQPRIVRNSGILSRQTAQPVDQNITSTARFERRKNALPSMAASICGGVLTGAAES
jgi:hypothetical protein